jgi:hypothetical protein
VKGITPDISMWKQTTIRLPIPGESRSEILDRLYRAQALISRLNETPEIVAELDAVSWEALYEVLFCRRRVPPNYRVEDEQVLTVLRAARKWAHVVSNPPLEFWAGTVAWHWMHGSPAVVEAAEACHPALQSRWRRTHQETTLLRAAADPARQAEDLLRPASGSAEQDARALLRPNEEKTT